MTEDTHKHTHPHIDTHTHGYLKSGCSIYLFPITQHLIVLSTVAVTYSGNLQVEEVVQMWERVLGILWYAWQPEEWPHPSLDQNYK